MRRPVARRRGGSVATTAGFLGVGLSSAVLLAAGPRLIGHTSFSGLGLAWTIASVFGFGIATPTEQVLTRRLNLGARNAARRPIRLLALAAVLVALATAIIEAHTPAARNFAPLVPGSVAAVLGWFVVVVVRARLAGAGDLLAYAVVLSTEAASRVAIVAVAIIARPAAAWLLAAAIGAPLMLAAAVGLLPRPMPGPTSTSGGDEVTAEQAAFMAVSLGYQVCLNAPPLLLEWRLGASLPAVVGAFVAANSYFRTPTVLMGGISTHALVELSHAWGSADRLRFSNAVHRSLRNIGLISIATTGAAGLASPILLRLYYGSDLRLPVLLLVALALSSVIAVIAAVAVQPLLAAGRGRPAALAWLAGAAVTSAGLALSSGIGAVVAGALVAGPVIALASGVWALRRLLRPASLLP